MKKYKGISKHLKNKVLARDKYTCQKCKTEDKTRSKFEVHHVNPKYKGGEDKEENLITLCYICHRYAPNSIEEFNEYMSSELDGMTDTLIKTWKKFINSKEGKELTKEING
ncbi:HNH endonuclease [Patescibacteria group bacterium]|nr:HNH endonuclease [Patescibacteria group bacterium]